MSQIKKVYLHIGLPSDFDSRSQLERIQILKANSDAVKKMELTKTLSEEERRSLESQNMEISLRIRQLEAERKEINQLLKAEKKEQSTVVSQFDLGSEVEEQEAYIFFDQPTSQKHIFDSNGNYNTTLPLKHSERQNTLQGEIRSSGTQG